MKNLLFLSLFFLGMSFSSCGGGSNPSSENSDGSEESSSSTNASNSTSSESGGGEATGEPKNLAEAMQQATKAIEDAGLGNQSEVVNFRELQKQMPEDLAGMERISKGGQTAGAMGMDVSTAESKFKAADGTIVEITLVDTGGLGLAMMSGIWATAMIDKEDEYGSERTSTLDGFKSYEKTRNRDNSCELSVIAEGRYVATAKCKECEIGLLKKAIRGMVLGDLPKGETK